jgi:SAM-dependent methyltransferase
MHYGLAHTLVRLASGQTLARIRMNVALAQVSISGKTIDVGGGRNPDYFMYLKHDDGVSIDTVDGSISGIDFETDPLPYGDSTVDTVISCNVLEHIYNHAHLAREMRRITTLNGRLIGFVPFWVGYHPDPHDYFRYTEEALRRIILDAGYRTCEIQTVGGGPILANFNTLLLSVPRFLRPVLYLPYVLLDTVMLTLRPKSAQRNPLGYMFIAYA